MNDSKTGVAYDPIENVDVEIECHGLHQSTDFEDIEGDSLPVLIESDFKHDPVEACQGSYTRIIEIEDGCPNCGYDRADASVHTLAGVHRESCRACGADITDRGREDFEPMKPRDPVESLRREEYVGEVKSNIKVYRRNDRLYGLLSNDRTFSIHGDGILSLARIVLQDMEEGDLRRSTGIDFVRLVAEAMPEAEENDEDDA